MTKKKILVAPLNWGLGHATRCIPIIKGLEEQQFVPVIASDGEALQLLRKEFPALENHLLPSYNITYSKTSVMFRWNLLLKTPHILKTISAENKVVEELVRTANISGIISDNRWGVRSPEVPSVFVTHQIRVLSGITTFISSKIQQHYIRQFKECWVPDVAEEISLSGKMSHLTGFSFPVRFLGILSRFKKKKTTMSWDIAVILSGPEPQREMLEKIMLRQLRNSGFAVQLVRGVVENQYKAEQDANICIHNYLQTEELEQLINSSELIICRPGYTSLMDMARLEKKLFVIPTPGQYEQEYLARRLKEKKIANSCRQNQFSINMLKDKETYSGLKCFNLPGDFRAAFTLFHSK